MELSEKSQKGGPNNVQYVDEELVKLRYPGSAMQVAG
jgi:hypothetical protein